MRQDTGISKRGRSTINQGLQREMGKLYILLGGRANCKSSTIN